MKNSENMEIEVSMSLLNAKVKRVGGGAVAESIWNPVPFFVAVLKPCEPFRNEFPDCFRCRDLCL